jgi:hypothetical protein
VGLHFELNAISADGLPIHGQLKNFIVFEFDYRKLGVEDSQSGMLE